MNRGIAIAAVALFAPASLLPACAMAAPADSWQLSDSWRFGVAMYGYLPTVGVKATFPNGVISDVSVGINDILDHLKMGFFGAAEAQKGPWGAFTDVIYMNVGATPTSTHSFTLGSGALPADVGLTTTMDLKATIWTLAGTYRAMANPDSTLDVLAGTRLLDVDIGQNYQLTGNVGPISLPQRSGTAGISVSDWNAIVGVKGRFAVNTDRTWFVPYYADVGTGESKLTWQVMGGGGYSFDWGDIVATWRYMEFENASDKPLRNLTMNGPQISFWWHW